jgi:hypothetical protein
MPAAGFVILEYVGGRDTLLRCDSGAIKILCPPRRFFRKPPGITGLLSL